MLLELFLPITHVHLHGGEDQHEGEVDPNGGIKAVGWEEVGEMGHHHAEDGGQAGRQQETGYLPLKGQLHLGIDSVPPYRRLMYVYDLKKETKLNLKNKFRLAN